MKNLVHNDDRIVSYDDSIPGEYKFVLKNKTKLSDVFSFLPHGIVNKTETGIGATTLELTAKRNSIIVEPIKVTASSKAYNRTDFLKRNVSSGFSPEGVLYVGSPTHFHPDKISSAKIKSYHDSSGFKKIVVVADSLWRVLSSIGDDVFKDYFLMVDEADSFQMDSSYRSAMNISIDYFKKFSETSRALVTATMLDFSDPEIKNIAKTVIKYDNPTTYNIRLIHTKTLKETAVDIVTNLVRDSSREKILVAYNSPDGCYDIAKHLEDNKVLQPEEQKILCSAQSKKKVSEFYTELEEAKLPSKVSYITSAYFSGFDLKEDLHVLTISDGKSLPRCLSEHKIKQIAGRCRRKVLSQTVIYCTQKEQEPGYTLEDYLLAGASEVKTLNCIEHNYSDNPVLKDNIVKLRDLLLGSFDGSMRYARLNSEKVPVIAYLNIDSKLESQRTRLKLYKHWSQLKNVLSRQGHKVSFEQWDSETLVAERNASKAISEQESMDVIKAVRALTAANQVDDLLDDKDWSSRQREILRVFSEYRKYVSWDSLLDLVEDAAPEHDDRKLKHLKAKLFLATYYDNSDYKKRLKQYFTIGEAYTADQLLDTWTNFFQHWDNKLKPKSKVKAGLVTGFHFETKKVGRSKKTALLSDNPLGIVINRKRDDRPITKLTIKELLLEV